MIRQASLSSYWSLVGACLVEFHHFSEKDADRALAQLRQRLKNAGVKTRSANDLVYHSEPIDVASDLAGEPVSMGKNEREMYAALKAHSLAMPRSKVSAIIASEGRKKLPSGFARIDNVYVAQVAEPVAKAHAGKTRKALMLS